MAGSSPVVLTGDFNCGRDSDPYRILSQKDSLASDAPAAFRDTAEVSATPHRGPDSTWNGFKQIAPGHVIDFVFVRGNIDVRSHATLLAQFNGRFASDHLPVMAELIVKPDEK